ncbi:hypothetical protein BDD12DRAFT_802362 [Trichophaea hybrida]|nr:hypothetical protein BDD12DRAFT_802362 [Trichophaea hybrida]
MYPDPDEDLEDPLQSIILIAREVINLDDDEEDEELAPEAAPVDDDAPELLPITNIATPSTPDTPPIEPVDLDFEVQDMENIKPNDADFNNMAITEHKGGTGNDIDSQPLNDEMMNNIYEDRLTDLMNNENFQRENVEELCKTLGITMENRIFLPHKTTTQLDPHQIDAVNWMADMENGLEQGVLLADDCGTSKTLAALALICHQVNRYKQLLKQLPPGLEQWQIKIDNSKVREAKGQKVEKEPPKSCWEVHLPTSILCPKPMVPEWENAIKKYTDLKPRLHYGSKFWRANDHHEAMKGRHPWRYVVITTIETYYQWQGVVG